MFSQDVIFNFYLFKIMLKICNIPKTLMKITHLLVKTFKVFKAQLSNPLNNTIYCHSPTKPQHELELDLIKGRNPPILPLCTAQELLRHFQSQSVLKSSRGRTLMFSRWKILKFFVSEFENN
jgi:hypothetical protein